MPRALAVVVSFVFAAASLTTVALAVAEDPCDAVCQAEERVVDAAFAEGPVVRCVRADHEPSGCRTDAQAPSAP